MLHCALGGLGDNYSMSVSQHPPLFLMKDGLVKKQGKPLDLSPFASADMSSLLIFSPVNGPLYFVTVKKAECNFIKEFVLESRGKDRRSESWMGNLKRGPR